MRIPLVAAFLLVSVAAAAAADGGRWCYRDFGGPQYTNCSFYSARQCLAAAGVIGGVCERKHEVAPPRRPRKARR